MDEQEKNLFDSLVTELANAARKAFLKLFENGEKYYYCTLVTSGELFCPHVNAWSYEALERELSEQPEEKREGLRQLYKWSYTDTPYMAFEYNENYYQRVVELFNQLPPLHECFSNGHFDDEKFEKLCDFRLNIMEQALKKLDEDGIFALNQPREEVYINVEIMPPDYSNTERALRLNKAENIKAWLEEAAENEE